MGAAGGARRAVGCIRVWYRGRESSRLGIDEWSVVKSCEVCASRF
ncbi:hypothetical protein [Rubritalea tangerina]